jgi:hypothetical protein
MDKRLPIERGSYVRVVQQIYKAFHGPNEIYVHCPKERAGLYSSAKTPGVPWNSSRLTEPTWNGSGEGTR